MSQTTELAATERLLTPVELGALIPSRHHGKSMTGATIRRWMFHGIRGVYLPYRMVGSQPCATREMFFDFIEELTAADGSRRFHARNTTMAQDEPAVEPVRQSRAVARAKELGIA